MRWPEALHVPCRHPLLMALAFPVLMGEAVIAYRAPLAPSLEQCAHRPFSIPA